MFFYLQHTNRAFQSIQCRVWDDRIPRMSYQPHTILSNKAPVSPVIKHFTVFFLPELLKTHVLFTRLYKGLWLAALNVSKCTKSVKHAVLGIHQSMFQTGGYVLGSGGRVLATEPSLVINTSMTLDPDEFSFCRKLCSWWWTTCPAYEIAIIVLIWASYRRSLATLESAQFK